MQHMVIDLVGCTYFPSTEALRRLVNDLVDLLGMHKKGEAHITELAEGTPMDGTSLLQLIVESHIAIHTFPLKWIVYVDIFSCKRFSYGIVLDHFREMFVPREYGWKDVGRIPLDRVECLQEVELAKE